MKQVYLRLLLPVLQLQLAANMYFLHCARRMNHSLNPHKHNILCLCGFESLVIDYHNGTMLPTFTCHCCIHLEILCAAIFPEHIADGDKNREHHYSNATLQPRHIKQLLQDVKAQYADLVS